MPGPDEPAWANAGLPWGEPGQRQRTADIEEPAVEIDRLDQVGVRPDALFLVVGDRVGIPAVPQPRDNVDELLGPCVTVRGIRVCREPEVDAAPCTGWSRCSSPPGRRTSGRWWRTGAPGR